MSSAIVLLIIIFYYYYRIISSHLSHIRKRPFLRYLIWTYMNTESDQVNAEGLALSHGE